ncbi:HU family DNA-binding protein [Aliiroseovarius sp. S1339]|uniref:HU family DNA-binding protein n=1 Tax=Aliiroseovarius sp. S1339 TaxID=2936990 RepID=UPI0020BDFEF4|nr:HU family DNA-binding protein [Aliiroseovarius sp. S1339]MCK8462644.1 HU family DNA-binding protein [Aliiroseovarius sp. S1339]
MAASTKSTSKAKHGTAAAAKRGVAKPSQTAPSKEPKTDSLAAPKEPVVKKKDLMARVAARANLRPSEVRTVYDAVLQELGDALLRGEKLRLPPLGLVKVNRHKELPDADIIVCKIRRNKATGSGKDELAPTDE